MEGCLLILVGSLQQPTYVRDPPFPALFLEHACRSGQARHVHVGITGIESVFIPSEPRHVAAYLHVDVLSSNLSGRRVRIRAFLHELPHLSADYIPAFSHGNTALRPPSDNPDV